MLLALLPALALAQAPTITIRAGTVLDGRGGILHNTTIVIAGSRIARLDPALTAATYDLSRLTVMPGGIDTHVHLTSHFDANGRAHNDPGGAEPLDQTVLYTEENAYCALMAGITTVQSIGSTLDRDLRDAIARGTVPGPRVITSLDWITPADGDADGLRRTVQQRVAAGADVIKILPRRDALLRSEEHTSELQSRSDIVCRLLLEKKKKKKTHIAPLARMRQDKKQVRVLQQGTRFPRSDA